MYVIEEESTGEGVDEGDEAGGSNSQPGSSSQTSGSIGGLTSNATSRTGASAAHSVRPGSLKLFYKSFIS